MLYPEADSIERPRTRADCKDMPRPCVFVGCRYNLYLDVNPSTGSIKFNHPDLEPDEVQASCALDVAEAQGATLEEVGFLINMTRERVRQIEEKVSQQLHDLEEAEQLRDDVNEYLEEQAWEPPMPPGFS